MKKVAKKSQAIATKAGQDFLRRAEALIRIPSVAGDHQTTRQALEYVATLIRKHTNLTLEYFERNNAYSFLAYHGTKRPKRFAVLLNGHVDVVPAAAEAFVPYSENGRLYGRGALDMKVAALIMADAFCEMAPKVAYPLGLQITTDEEPGGYDGAKYQYEQGVRADFFITGEQSWNDIAIAAKGMCRLKIRRRGHSAHSAYLWRGENAVLKLTQLVQKLHQLYPSPKEEAWVTTVNVARLHTLSAGHFNKVPDEAELHLDIRVLADDPHFTSLSTIRAFFATLDPEAEIIHATFEKGHEVDATHPGLTALATAVKTAKGSPAKFLRRHGQSDLRHYIVDPQTVGVEFGLKGKHDHGEGEYVDFTSIPIMQRALHTFLLEPGVA